MDGQPTSGSLARARPGSWRAFFAFLGRPELPARAAGVGRAGLTAVARLYSLDILVMVLLIGSLGALTMLGVEMPEHALEGLEIGAALIAFIVIGAPIGEEVLFRGWLSGRPGHVFALLIALAGGALAFLAVKTLPQPASGFAALAILALIVAGMALSLWFGRERPAWGWFQRHFRWFYYLSALAFAGVHLANFAGAGAAMLPLTLPQLFLALILGKLRVEHGLWASVLFHAAHNALFIGIVVAATAAQS